MGANKIRDRFVHWACNFMLNHIASKWYRDMIDQTIQVGLANTPKKAGA